MKQATWENLALAALVVGAWLLYPKNYVFSDQLGYLLRAWHLADIGQWGEKGYRLFAYGAREDVYWGPIAFDFRLGVLFPHWLSYQLLGPGKTAAFLPQLGFMLVMLFTVWHYCENLLQKVCAGVVLSRIFYHSADVLPDLGLAAMMFLALHCLARRNEGAVFGLLFSLTAFYAGLIKLPAYYMALFFSGVLAADLMHRHRHSGDDEVRFYLAAILSGLALLTAYAVFSHYVYGGALARIDALHAVEEFRRTVPIGFDWGDWSAAGIGDYAHRLFVESTAAGYGLFGIAYFLALVQAAIILCLRQGGGMRLIAIYLPAAIAFLVFSPLSLLDWQPLPLLIQDSRYAMFLAPPVAVLSARLISDLLFGAYRASKFHRIATAAVAGLCILAVTSHSLGWSVRDFSRKGGWLIEVGRTAAIEELQANDNAVLALSDSRNHRSLFIYADFDEALYSRVLLCDTGPHLNEGRDLIVYIDKKLSAWLAQTYPASHGSCNAELLRLSAAQGHAVLMDNDAVYLSSSTPPPPPA